jgi:hypothetical protein
MVGTSCLAPPPPPSTHLALGGCTVVKHCSTMVKVNTLCMVASHSNPLSAPKSPQFFMVAQAGIFAKAADARILHSLVGDSSHTRGTTACSAWNSTALSAQPHTAHAARHIAALCTACFDRCALCDQCPHELSTSTNRCALVHTFTAARYAHITYDLVLHEKWNLHHQPKRGAGADKTYT